MYSASYSRRFTTSVSSLLLVTSSTSFNARHVLLFYMFSDGRGRAAATCEQRSSVNVSFKVFYHKLVHTHRFCVAIHAVVSESQILIMLMIWRKLLQFQLFKDKVTHSHGQNQCRPLKLLIFVTFLDIVHDNIFSIIFY